MTLVEFVAIAALPVSVGVLVLLFSIYDRFNPPEMTAAPNVAPVESPREARHGARVFSSFRLGDTEKLPRSPKQREARESELRMREAIAKVKVGLADLSLPDMRLHPLFRDDTPTNSDADEKSKAEDANRAR